MTPDVLAQPLPDGGKVAACAHVVEVHSLGDHGRLELGAKGAAQRVGGEVAKVAARPVGVLQRAVGVVGNVQAQVLLVLLGPKPRHVPGRCLAAKEQLLNLVAHQDVQRIGQLVGVAANEAGLGAVLGQVELARRDVAQLSREALAHDLEQRARKGLGASHDVLEEARLRFVHAHRRAALKRGHCVRHVDALLVEGVATLVQHAKDVGQHVFAVDVAGD